jgi:putative ABC transport system permease protein
MNINNLYQAFRSLRHQKGFATLNFLGLTVALTVALLTGLMVFHEVNFDRFHPDGDRLFRVVTQYDGRDGERQHFAGPAAIVPSVAKAELGELGQWTEVNFHDKEIVRLSPTQFFEEKNLVFVDTAFFSLFNFEVISGNARAAMAVPNQVLLTESTAARYFPKENALGKRITLDVEACPVKEFEVAGILADAPANSHLPFQMLVSSASVKIAEGDLGWGWFYGGQYLFVKPGVNISPVQVGQRFTDVANERKDKEDESRHTYSLQPIADIHTNMTYADGNPSYTADFEQFYWLGAIALFLLLVAVVNYVNLATAIAQRKSREVGVRKTLGASRGQLAARFWVETALLVAAAIVCSMVVANAVLPVLNQFLDRNIVANWFSPQTLGLLAALFGATTLLAGFYPAIVMAGFSPTEAFRGKALGKGTQASLHMRRGLVAFQFVVAQVLIVAVIVAASQMSFIRSKPLGFGTVGVVNMRVPQEKPEQIDALRTEFARIPGVLSTSNCIGAPTSNAGFTTVFNWPELYEQQTMEVVLKVADPQYLETYGLALLAGRNLQDGDLLQVSDKIPKEERKYVCLLNETAIKRLGVASPAEALGRKVKTGFRGAEATIVGVVGDFHTRSLREELQSVAILPLPRNRISLGIRLDPAAANTATLAKMETIWKTFFPGEIFTAAFLDDYLASLYRTENKVFSIFKIMALLALLINALGLIGLTVFVVEAKTKEIGIRKVLGASVASVMRLLTLDFFKLAMVALVLATPLAWWAMNKWLAGFAYRIDIQWWMFAVAGTAAVVIAFLTVGFQSVRAALANPVKSLRSE